MDGTPLVSVVVMTYNSSATIIETLDSIKVQSYNNIELIVSDDNSKDNTVDICRQWVKQNGACLNDVIIITSPQNTGVAPNINRGIRASHGEWIKSIAGDDTLTPDCIREFVNFSLMVPECRICLSLIRVFGADENLCKSQEVALEMNTFSYIRNTKRDFQYRECLYHHIMPGPSIFYQKSLWSEVGGFNEMFPNGEEHPFEIEVLKRTKLYLVDKYLVNWRVSPNSLSRNKFSKSYKEDIDVYRRIRRPLMKKEKMLLEIWDRDIFFFIKSKNYKLNKDSLYRFLMIFSPLWWRKHLSVALK